MTMVRITLMAALLALVAMAGCRSAHTTAAILYIDEQNYNKAVEVIHEGFQYVDNEPDAYFYLGDAYSHLAEEAVEADDFVEAKKNYELAYDAYSRTLEINREEFDEQVTQALKYNYNNRIFQAKLDWDEKYYEQAEGHLRLAYAALPDSVTPVKSIARMKMQMSREPDFADQETVLMEEALTLLDQVLESNPEAYLLRSDKANVLAALGRSDEAGAIYADLLREHGDDSALLADIANLAISDGDYEKAADFYVRIVDLHEGDTDATNDDQNKDMLLSAGSWFGVNSIGRYDDAIAALERAANLEMVPTEVTMLQRLKTYYQFGSKLQDEARVEEDPEAKATLLNDANAKFQRAVEVGNAMTQVFAANSQGFFFLSAAQAQLGDLTASEANYKTYQELTDTASGLE